MPVAGAGTHFTGPLYVGGDLIAPGAGVAVTTFGAVGDGTTDDTASIREAITEAGVGGTVVFRPGHTYVISGRLVPLAGQTWIGYGATLKRGNQVTGATATAIGTSAATNQLLVPDGSVWRVGQDVTVLNGALYDPANHAITAISGRTLTIATAFTQAFVAGGTVVSSVSIIDAGASLPTRAKILGLTIDGNKTNNTSLTKWENHKDLYLAADGALVRDCYIHDSQSEGIVIGGVGCAVERCHVESCNGNGIHISGSEGARVVGNYVKDCNLAGTTPGHADGCICLSSTVEDTLIEGNYIENGISGIGSIDSDDNSSVTIIGNTIRSCATYGLEMIVSDVNVGKVLIQGNQFYDCGPVSIYNNDSTPTADTGPYRVLITGNYLQDTKLDIRRAFDLTITDNQIASPGTQTGVAANIYYPQRALIANNQIRGFQYGVYIDGAAGSEVPAAVQVTANTCTDQFTNGIRFQAASTLAVVAQGNLITTSSIAASTAYAGIQLQNGIAALNNILHLQSGQYGIVCPNGSSVVAGSVVSGNVIRSASGIASIRTNGGSQQNQIINNFVQQAVNDGGSPNNTVTGTVTIL